VREIQDENQLTIMIKIAATIAQISSNEIEEGEKGKKRNDLSSDEIVDFSISRNHHQNF
jgi:hypothetical protein